VTNNPCFIGLHSLDYLQSLGGWTFNEKLATVFCTKYDNSEEFNTIIVKTIAVNSSGEVNYLFNGNSISHCDLPLTFSTF
jgi:hypothetical protein